jgi:hypothetical protein
MVQRNLVLRFLVQARKLREELGQAAVHRDRYVVWNRLVDGDLLHDAVDHLPLGKVDQALGQLEGIRISILDKCQIGQVHSYNHRHGILVLQISGSVCVSVCLCAISVPI